MIKKILLLLLVLLFAPTIVYSLPDCPSGQYPRLVAGMANTYTCSTCPQHTCEEGITPTYKPNTCEYYCEEPDCTSNNDCPGSYCSQEGFCVECTSDRLCLTSGLGSCSNNLCCSANQVGFPPSNECVCDPANPCASSQKESYCTERVALQIVAICGTQDNSCPGRVDTIGCSGDTPYCDEFGNSAACVACLDDTHCTSSEKPYCVKNNNLQTSTCQECRNNQHCGVGEVCLQGSCAPDPCSGVECGLVGAISCGVCSHPEQCVNNQCVMPSEGSFTKPSTNAQPACVIEEHGARACEGTLEWMTSDAQEVGVFNNSLVSQENLLSTQSQGIITTTATLFEQTMFLRHECDETSCLGLPNPLATRNFFAECGVGLHPHHDGRCVECLTSNDCDQGFVCGSDNVCVKPSLGLELYYENDLVEEPVLACNTIEVVATCEVSPSGSLQDLTITSDGCEMVDETNFICETPGEYEFTCHSRSHQSVSASQTITLEELPPTISGDIYDQEGFLLQGHEISVYASKQGEQEYVTTTTSGSYSLTLPPGDYWLFARHESDTYVPTPVEDETLVCGGDQNFDFVLTQEVQCTTPCADSFGVCNYACLGVGGCELDDEFFSEYADLLNHNFSTDIFSKERLIDELIIRCEGASPGYRRAVPNAPGHYFVCCGSANSGTYEPPEDEECPEGHGEKDGYCYPICDEDIDCPNNHECSAGLCVSPIPPYKPSPQTPILYYPEQEAKVTSDARHQVQTTRLVNYYGLPVRMNVVVISN